ncbi:MAG TPA: hypothetical protein VII11_03665, partial [Bacteroidota bacterium]
MNQSSHTAFGVYEFFRITVPGFYVAALTVLLYRCFVQTFLIAQLHPAMLLFLFLFLIIVAGLTLYANETTKRRKAFLENQPSRYLSDKARTMKNMPLLDET